MTPLAKLYMQPLKEQIIKIWRFQSIAKYTDYPSQLFHNFVSSFKVDQYFNNYKIISTQKKCKKCKNIILSYQDTAYLLKVIY